MEAMTAMGGRQGRPVIGLTTYREQAAWGVWNMSSDLLPSVYTRSVEAAGGVVVLLGLLRLVQTEVDRTARGSLSWLAYLIVLAVCGLGIALALSRIKRDSLDKPGK